MATVRRGAGAVERDGLENRSPVLNRAVGSNPTPAARQPVRLARVARAALWIASLVAVAGAVAAWSPGATTARSTGSLRVLFIGNSLTATNDLPAMVVALGARRGRAIQVETRAPGGFALEDHWNLTDVRDRLARGGLDWVVMQQGPSSLPESGVNLRQWSLVFADASRAAGATPALLTVWPEWYRRGVFAAVIGNYREAARESGSVLMPAGAVWKASLARAPRLPLYGGDGFHPSPLGTYAAAVTVYARLTGTSPIGLPTRLDVDGRTYVFRARYARIIQRSAAAALKASDHPRERGWSPSGTFSGD